MPASFLFTASVTWTNGATVTGNILIRFHNGTSGLFYGQQHVRSTELEASVPQSRTLSAVVTAVATDYFEVKMQNLSGSNLTVEGDNNECRFTAEFLGT